MTQAQQIKEHLEKGHGISALMALKMFGCLRLASRIYDLKDDGMSIRKEMVTHNGKTFARYTKA